MILYYIPQIYINKCIVILNYSYYITKRKGPVGGWHGSTGSLDPSPF